MLKIGNKSRVVLNPERDREKTRGASAMSVCKAKKKENNKKKGRLKENHKSII